MPKGINVLFSFLLGAIISYLLCPTTGQRETQLDPDVRALTDRIFHPTQRVLEHPEIENPKQEYKSRLNRVKSVCAKWRQTNWYRENVLPAEHETLESWLKVSFN